MRRRLFVFLLFLAIFSAGLSLASFASAQTIDVGVNAITNGFGDNGLSDTDPRVIVARIINIALLFLGVIAVGLIVYAGFLWMTSGGDEEKIGQAKKILKNGIIGLVIILSSWGIATFILNRLLGATGNGGNGGDNQNNSSLLGTGAIGACTIERVYPENGQTEVARNASLIVTFKEALRSDSVCQNASGDSCSCNQTDCKLMNPAHIRIFRQDLGDLDATNVSRAYIKASADRKTFIITPTDFLGSPDGNIDYNVKLTNGLVKDDGKSVFQTCSSDYFQWGFQVSNKLDLTPPQVARGGIFPFPDNEKDVWGQVQEAVAATSSIQVSACPHIYQPAAILGVVPVVGGHSATATIDPDYHANLALLTVVAIAGDKAQLFSGQDLLGVADWQGNKADFSGFFQIEVSGRAVGNSWRVNLRPEVLADNLTVGSEIYNFAATSTGNNIFVDNNNCQTNTVAAAIYHKLSGHPEVNAVSQQGNKINLMAKVAGAAGNNLLLTASNSEALSLTPFSGGRDRIRKNEIKGRQDRPRNSVIQLNFNEAVNPLLVSGDASSVSPYLRVVSAEATASSTSGGLCKINSDCASNKCVDKVCVGVCTKDSDCLSYNCVNNSCVGSYLNGKFMVANGYKTVEFISDKECGQNGCGDKIYCLPANSHLAVELVPANLKSCVSNDDCANFPPFTVCSAFSNNYKTCQDPAGKNYPVANLDNLDGIVDAAMNSLDGNRDVFADGPKDFYNENNASNTPLAKDKYKWSFFVNDEIRIAPPQISLVNPENNGVNANTAAPVQINFNTLMMNSTMLTGSTMVNNGQTDVEHHLINIFSSSPTPIGYWITAENRDVSPLDGEPDLTFALINHTNLVASASYKTQVGSGVKDIYQNCYKPSSGPSCTANEANPSCCYGTATNVLGEDGNCQ